MALSQSDRMILLGYRCERGGCVSLRVDRLRLAMRRLAAQDTALGFAPMRKPRFESGRWPPSA